MHSTLSLMRREFSAYFLSPIGYVVFTVFLVVTGHLFYLTMLQLTASGSRGIYFPMQITVSNNWFWLVFLFIPPLLTMRLFAEERGSGTLEMLLTAPLRDWQIVLCKFAACFGFYILLWVPTLVYLPVILDGVSWEVALGVSLWLAIVATVVLTLAGPIMFVRGTVEGSVPRVLVGLVCSLLALAGFVGAGLAYYEYGWDEIVDSLTLPVGIDPWPVVSTYLGLALVGAMFLALGMFISSLVKSQMVAALLSLFFGLIFIVAGFWGSDLDAGTSLYQVLFFFTVPLHFERNFSRGLVDTRQLVLYVSVALFCLFLTVRSLESRRWR
jgi:ABC-type transport system involved in multi-copper enzyme maturation permease subunit